MNATKNQMIKMLRNQGFNDEILSAFRKVDRRKFVPDEYTELAYQDAALPIGFEQTISQPQTIAFMLELLDVVSGQKILEVGSGSGYVLSLLAEMNKEGIMYGVEIIPELAYKSCNILKKYKNIGIELAFNDLGLETKAPFDRILVSAQATKIHDCLLRQLRENGILVCPVGSSIIKAEKTDSKYKFHEYSGFVFVPLIEGNK